PADVLPLGSGALAGTGFAVDREALARDLGFAAVSPNSLDAVSDRDYVVEFLGAGAITGMHLSRLAADLTLWATAEFGFVEFSDAFATGSSIMPQKKNPDVAELIRGKSGRRYGLDQGKTLDALTLGELRRFSELFEADVTGVLSVDASLRARAVTGGTAPEAVRRALETARGLVARPA